MACQVTRLIARLTLRQQCRALHIVTGQTCMTRRLALSVCKDGHPAPPVDCSMRTSCLEDHAQALSLSVSRLHREAENSEAVQARSTLGQEYKLPSYRRTLHYRPILDPQKNRVVTLPSFRSDPNLEKVTPTSQSVVPIEDPSPLQRVLDQGAPPVEKEAMPWLMRIRKRKMKKHKLHKLRKRMIFLNRKLREIKRKKKEKILLAYEAKFKKLAKDFDPEKFIQEEISKARKGNWSIDIFENREHRKL